MLHILSASHLHVPSHMRQEFEDVRTGLLRDFQPVNTTQTEFTNSAIRAAWQIRRCDEAERELAAELNRDPLLSHDKRFDRIQRTRIQAQRDYKQALAELKKIQTDHMIRRLAENEGLKELPVPIDTKVYIQAARAAGGYRPYQKIVFGSAQKVLDKLARDQGLGQTAWEAGIRRHTRGERNEANTA